MSHNPFGRPSFREVEIALKAVAKIQRPEGDNEHLPLNHPDILDRLSSPNREAVERADSLAREFVRDGAGESNRRAVNTLTRNGFPADCGPAQEDPNRTVGSIKLPNGDIDVSDPSDDQSPD